MLPDAAIGPLVADLAAIYPGPIGGFSGLRLADARDTALAQSWGAAASLDSGIAALDGNLCVELIRAKLRASRWLSASSTHPRRSADKVTQRRRCER